MFRSHGERRRWIRADFSLRNLTWSTYVGPMIPPESPSGGTGSGLFLRLVDRKDLSYYWMKRMPISERTAFWRKPRRRIASLVLRTFSKLYGMAGLRVGFAVGAKAVVAEVEKSRGPFKVSQVAERAAVAALEDNSGWAQRIRNETIANRERLTGELKLRGLHALPSHGNFLLIPVEPASAVEVNRALQARGVAGRPFPRLPELGETLRITIGPWDLMERFLQALDQLFESDSPEGGKP